MLHIPYPQVSDAASVCWNLFVSFENWVRQSHRLLTNEQIIHYLLSNTLVSMWSTSCSWAHNYFMQWIIINKFCSPSVSLWYVVRLELCQENGGWWIKCFTTNRKEGQNREKMIVNQKNDGITSSAEWASQNIFSFNVLKSSLRCWVFPFAAGKPHPICVQMSHNKKRPNVGLAFTTLHHVCFSAETVQHFYQIRTFSLSPETTSWPKQCVVKDTSVNCSLFTYTTHCVRSSLSLLSFYFPP